MSAPGPFNNDGDDPLLEAGSEPLRAQASPQAGESSFPSAEMIALPKAKLDRYELLHEIARGGVGVIFRARDREQNRELAVKVLHEGFANDRNLVLRFAEEAKIVERLQHPGVAPIHEVGARADGTPYFAMNLVEGCPLSQLLGERVSPHEHRLHFLGCFLKICQTVAYAHSRGVIHRDLRPAIVMVGAFGELQLMDWGVATSSNRDQPCDSELLIGSVLGTPSYLAPEQARGAVRALDERTDVFGLGGILCEILTGEPPYRGAQIGEILKRARDADLAPAIARIETSGFDRELVSLARRCLAVDPAERPRHAGLVVDEMSAYLSSVEERSRSSQLAAAAARARAQSERKSKRRLVVLTAAALVVIFTVAGGAFWLLERSRNRSTQAALTVGLALEEAERARLEARQSPVEDVTAWTKALEALRRAEVVPRSEIKDTALITRLLELRDSLVAEHEQARVAAERALRGRGLIDALEKAREQQGGAGWLAGVPPYEEVLKKYEIDIETASIEAVGQAIGATGVADKIALTLDHWALAKRWTQPERSDEWKRLVEIARRVDPDSSRDKIRQALVDDDLGALARISQAAELSQASTDTKSLVDACVLLVLAGRSTLSAHDSSLRTVLASLHEAPRNGEAWAQAAAVFQSMGNPLEAIEAWRQSVIAKPSDPELRKELSVALMASGLMAEAADALEAATRLVPRRESYWLLLADAREGLGELADAVGAAEMGVRLQPASAEGQFLLGRLLMANGRYEEAVAAIERGINLDHGTPGASHPQAQGWIVEAKAMMELDRKLEELRRGATRPADNLERTRAALLFHQRFFHATATRFFAEAFEWDASLVPSQFLVASRAAARAAQGEGADGREATDDERARFVQLAQTWILTGVEASDRAHRDASLRKNFTRDVRRLLGDVSLAPLRSPEALGFLPASRIEEISKLWKGLAARSQRP